MYTTISSFLQLLMLLSLCSIQTSANPVPGEINRDQFEEDKEYGSCERVGRVFYDDYTVVGHNLQVNETELKFACKGRYRPLDGMYGWTGIEFKLTKWKFEETWEKDVQEFVATFRLGTSLAGYLVKSLNDFRDVGFECESSET